MCGGVRRQVNQSLLERAQRAMHDDRRLTFDDVVAQCNATTRRRERALREMREEQRRVAWLERHFKGQPL